MKIMSNPFAVLNDSDDETPVKPIKTTAASGGGEKKTSTGGGKKTGGKADDKNAKENSAPIVGSDIGNADKDKKKNTNKNRKTQPKTEKSSNNQRRSDSDANAKKVSKGGGGSRNWGNEGDEARQASKGYGGDYESNDNGGGGEDDDDNDAESEPEPITFTLEEYMAQKAGEKKDSTLFGKVKERKVDGAIGGTPVDHEEVGDYLVVGGLKENKQQKEKKGRKAQVIAVDLLSAQPSSQSVFQSDRRQNSNYSNNKGGDRNRDGSGRGGRGGRGDGGRGNRRGYSLDVSSFPSL